MYFYNPNPDLDSRDQLVTLDAQEKLEIFIKNDSESDRDDSDSEETNLMLRRDQMNVQLHDDFVPSNFFAASDIGMTPNGNEYVRTLPDQYGDDTENLFMKHIVE